MASLRGTLQQLYDTLLAEWVQMRVVGGVDGARHEQYTSKVVKYRLAPVAAGRGAREGSQKECQA